MSETNVTGEHKAHGALQKGFILFQAYQTESHIFAHFKAVCFIVCILPFYKYSYLFLKPIKLISSRFCNVVSFIQRLKLSRNMLFFGL